MRAGHALGADWLEKGNFLFICPEEQRKGASRGANIGDQCEEDRLSSGTRPGVPSTGHSHAVPNLGYLRGDVGAVTEDKPLRNP